MIEVNTKRAVGKGFLQNFNGKLWLWYDIWTEKPIRYADGSLAYDHPERMPKYLRNAAAKELERAFLLGTPYGNDYFQGLIEETSEALLMLLNAINGSYGRGNVEAVYLTNPDRGASRQSRFGVARVRLPKLGYEFPEIRLIGPKFGGPYVRFRGRRRVIRPCLAAILFPPEPSREDTPLLVEQWPVESSGIFEDDYAC